MPITRKTLAALDWQTQFEESGFKVMTARGLDGFAIIHQKNSAGRTRIRYGAFGTKFDSPSEAIKHYNREEAARLAGRRGAAAGAE